MNLAGKKILLGVSGGIAVYKSCELLRLLQKKGAEVRVCMTDAATEFVAPLTFASLSKCPVYLKNGAVEARPFQHIDFPRWADLYLVVPATANVIGKFACGIADDPVSLCFMSCTCPRVIAPAMNVAMYNSPAVKRNLEILRSFENTTVLESPAGELACGEVGQGRLMEPSQIVEWLEGNNVIAQAHDRIGSAIETASGSAALASHVIANPEGVKQSITRADLERVLPQFTGDIEQIPPKYCAVKINGVRASDLMERGRNIELKPRKIHISELKVLGEGGVTEGCSGKEFATFDLICECSKGTYIRALGRDIGRALGTYACVSQIRRHRIGNVTLDKAVRGENLTRENLLPVDAVLDFPVVRLSPEQVAVIRQGNWLPWKEKIEGVGPEGHVFAANMQGEVLALCFYEPGRIKPKFYLGEDE